MVSKVLFRHRLKIIVVVVLVVITYHVFTLNSQAANSGGVAGSNGSKLLDVTADNRIQNPVGDVVASKPDSNNDETVKLPITDASSKANGDKLSPDVGGNSGGDSKAAKLGDDGKAKPLEYDVDESLPGKVKGTGKSNGKGSSLKSDSLNVEISPDVLKSIRDYTIFFEPFLKHIIKAPSLKDNYITEKAKELFSTAHDFLFSKKYLENVLNVADNTVKELKDSHKRYLSSMHDITSRISTFGNILASDAQWKDYQGSKGYVLIGGGRYSWLSYLVIRQIRATGSTIPIELFIPSLGEYEKDFCETVLPKYNAHCNLFDDKLTAELDKKYNIGGYQYKMLALLSSKFENVIYLDLDNFPVRNPEYILDSDLYKEKGLILWPDAWSRTTNPKFYDIAGVEVKQNKIRYSAYDKAHDQKPLSDYTFADSHYHDFEGTLPDPTSETGMLIINKTKHVRTLLLTLYYNVLGPNYYYPLMTQGSAGEGDKETFIAAAHVLGEPWYQTLKQFKWCGYINKNDDKFTSKALGHYDPIKAQDNPEADLDIVFMHLSYPKFYPNWLVDNHDLIYQLGDHIRMYADVYGTAGYDFDLRVLQYFTQGMCPNYYNEGTAIDDATIKDDEYMGKYLSYVGSDQATEEQRCKDVFIPHLKWLKQTTKYPDLLKT